MSAITWLHLPATPSNWRNRARAAMFPIVDEWPDKLDITEPSLLLAAIDAAYPFGQRTGHPYKMWLQERRRLISMLRIDTAEQPATADDYAACLVAIDLVEEGRDDEARKLLDAQAPGRLRRKCPACGRAVSRPCREGYDSTEVAVSGTDQWNPLMNFVRIRDMVVPHLARVEPRRVTSGPLFDTTPERQGGER